MNASGTYSCRLTTGQHSAPVTCAIGSETLDITSAREKQSLNYADLQDIRLLNYHLFLTTTKGELELSELGHDTESFFENLWNAYMQRSKESLFAEGTPLYN
ncbi:MAG: hypothetical protein J6T64_02380, partial [Bacteroidaceae bacterium]|nr:hypothetical protein [Bacteroidaceae bacterium]